MAIRKDFRSKQAGPRQSQFRGSKLYTTSCALALTSLLLHSAQPAFSGREMVDVSSSVPHRSCLSSSVWTYTIEVLYCQFRTHPYCKLYRCSPMDYGARNPGFGGLLRGLKSATGLAVMGLTSLGSLGAYHLFAHRKPHQAFYPKEGIDKVLVRPGPDLLVVGPPGWFGSGGEAAHCVFSYNKLFAAQSNFLSGAEAQEGWLYGMAPGNEVLMYPTGDVDDVVEGQLYCWPEQKFSIKLQQADWIMQYTPHAPQNPNLRRAVAPVVTQSGTVKQAYLYYQPEKMGYSSPICLSAEGKLVDKTRERELVGAAVGGSKKVFSDLPGDPSLILHTNVDLGKDKLMVMQALSRAIASCLSKPEAYVAVCLNDNQSLIWAGHPTPCALGTMCSIGSINQDNNAALSQAVANILGAYQISSDRIYINFFDVPRENCGWSGGKFSINNSFFIDHSILKFHLQPAKRAPDLL
eukprot:g56251.t1